MRTHRLGWNRKNYVLDKRLEQIRAKNVELYAYRVQNGLDIWTGERHEVESETIDKDDSFVARSTNSGRDLQVRR